VEVGEWVSIFGPCWKLSVEGSGGGERLGAKKEEGEGSRVSSTTAFA